MKKARSMRVREDAARPALAMRFLSRMHMSARSTAFALSPGCQGT